MILEGEKISIGSLKIVQKVLPPEKRTTLAQTQVIVFPFSLERRGNGTIVAANDCTDPRGSPVRRFDRQAMIAVGDQIQGEKLWGWAEKRLKVTVGGQSGRSGAHTGQSAEAVGKSLVRVFLPFSGIPIMPHPSTQYTLQQAVAQTVPDPISLPAR